MMYYIFDGTYYGWLCCVFETFERKEFNAIPIMEKDFQQDFFSNSRVIETNVDRAKRIIKGLEKQIGKNRAFDFYRAFLIEDPKVWVASMNLVVRIFKGNSDILLNYGDSDVLSFSDALHKVSRERHRMKAFIRFQKSSDGLYFAVIEPDFNVLPLIISFFKNRYTDQQWIIYDVKRNYGAHWDMNNVREVILDKDDSKSILKASESVTLDDNDAYFQKLWQRYFKSTNIEARKNMKLHLRHVPKRYWKYLPEKQI